MTKYFITCLLLLVFGCGRSNESRNIKSHDDLYVSSDSYPIFGNEENKIIVIPNKAFISPEVPKCFFRVIDKHSVEIAVSHSQNRTEAFLNCLVNFEASGTSKLRIKSSDYSLFWRALHDGERKNLKEILILRRKLILGDI